MGVDCEIQVKFLLPYVNVGSGKYSVLEANHVSFSGDIDTMGIKASFLLGLQIGSGNSCVIALNQINQKATYR